MRRALWIILVLLALVAGGVLVAWREGWMRSPWTDRYADLAAQLRDRGPTAVVGGVPFGMPPVEAPLIPAARHPELSRALEGRDPSAVATALRRLRLDGMLLRADAPAPRGSVIEALQRLRPVEGLSAVYLDENASVVEAAEPLSLSDDDGRRLVTVARLILSGAVAPPERIFPEALRRTRPVEVAVILRDGHDAILWRSTRGGSVARALLDCTFAVMDRWSTRQAERYGRLRDALRAHTVTVAIFQDRGVLGTRTPAFVRRAADPRVWSVGFERVTSWEYALPPTPWAPAQDPVAALTALARERAVPPPGWLRPEITLYRFRALQFIERAPGGEVERFDPR